MSESIVIPNATVQVDPTSATVVIPQEVMSAVSKDIALSKEVITMLKAKDYVGIVKLGLQNKAFIEDEVKEVSALVPLIKAGYKTTEFWLIVVYFGFNIFCILKGIALPIGDDSILGGLVATYSASRHYIKSKQ
jgi:hypothetical protein